MGNRQLFRSPPNTYGPFFPVPLTYLPLTPFTPHRHNRIAHDNVLEHRSSTKPARLHIQPRLVHRVRFLIKVSRLIFAAFQCVHRDTFASSAPKRQLPKPTPLAVSCHPLPPSSPPTSPSFAGSIDIRHRPEGLQAPRESLALVLNPTSPSLFTLHLVTYRLLSHSLPWALSTL